MELHQYNVTHVVSGGTKLSKSPSPLNYRRGGGGSQAKSGNRNSPEQNYQHRARQAQPKHKNKSELRTNHDHYHNPDPIAQLIGKRNESLVIVDDVKYLGLLDSGVQMSTITISQAKKISLKIDSLDNLLDIEGSSIVLVPYIGNVEVNLKIHEVKAYNEDVLMMVMNDSRYGDIIPFAIGTIITHAVLEVIPNDEWKNLSLAWKSAALPAYASRAAKMENFSLDSVKGDAKAHKATILPPFSTTFVKGRSTVKGHHKRVNVARE